MSNKIFIQPLENNFDEFLEYANKHNYNMEIASFAFGDTLDTNWKLLVTKYNKDLNKFSGIISIHGAFMDLILNSADKKIRKIAEERIIHNMNIAKKLNAKFIVFHGNFNPMLRHERARINWAKCQTEFWKPLVEKYKITVVLENLWEPDPELFKEIMDKVNSPFFKVCLDTGHANVFSKVPLTKWISILKNHLVYIHVNDNKGDKDSELPPGQGDINWKGFSNAIKKNKINPNIIFEVGNLKNSIKSINYFKKHKIYPFI